MAIPFASWVAWSFAFGVGSFFSSFSGTSVMPHFGHWPGSVRTTSGCIGHVYLCVGGEALGVGVCSAKAAVAAQVMAAAIKIKICLFMSMLKLIGFCRGSRAGCRIKL